MIPLGESFVALRFDDVIAESDDVIAESDKVSSSTKQVSSSDEPSATEYSVLLSTSLIPVIQGNNSVSKWL